MAQQVMVRVLEALGSYRPELQTFETWLVSVARHQAIDLLRRKRRAQVEAPEHIGERRERRPDAWIEEADRSGLGDVASIVNLLPKRQRAVLLLRYGFDLDTNETGRVLGCSAPHARQLQHRALRSLAQRLADEQAPRGPRSTGRATRSA